MQQHRFTEYQRKADQEAEKRRNLENEGKDNDVLFSHLQLDYNCWSRLQMQPVYDYIFVAWQCTPPSVCCNLMETCTMFLTDYLVSWGNFHFPNC